MHRPAQNLDRVTGNIKVKALAHTNSYDAQDL